MLKGISQSCLRWIGEILIKKYYFGILIILGLVYPSFLIEAARQDQNMSFFDQDQFILSNHPESFKYPGIMFWHTLDQPVRCMFHHRNVSKEVLNIGLMLMNTKDKPAKISMILGIGGPSMDIVFAGHKAAESFFESVLKIKPIQLEVPPHTTIPLFWLPVKNQQTVSGLFRLESSVSIDMKLIAFDHEYPSLASLTDIADIKMFKPALYQESIRKMTYEFDTQNQIFGFQIGGVPFVRDLNRDIEIKGNYGMIYQVYLKLKNSEKEKKIIRLFVQPAKLNSLDRGVFLIQGKLKSIRLLKFLDGVLNAELLEEWTLEPNQTKEIELITFPQAGCFYPIDMTLRVVQ